MQQTRFPLLFLLAGMGAAVLTATLFLYATYKPDTRDLQLLALFMSGSGSVTLVLAYLVYREGAHRRFTSLRWTLLFSIMLSILLVLPNVWFTARQMFISEHDFYLNVALLLFGALTAFTFGFFVITDVISRISTLSSAAESLAGGNLDTRLEVHGRDEISRFARTFNWMATSLEQLDEQQRMVDQARRDLIAWVSHDLRTPLTTMRAMLEAIADEVINDPDTIQRYMQNSLTEIANLNTLINDLFELAQIDAGHPDMQFVNASLRDLISDVLSRMKAQAETRRIALEGDIHSDIDPVYMAPDKIQRVLYNLIDNALRYTPPEGAITIRAYRRDEYVCVDVHNTGENIAPEHLPHLFNSFYRGEHSRVRSAEGQRSTGLGLAIARGFIEAHRGMIQVESTPEQGTTFRLQIPQQRLMA